MKNLFSKIISIFAVSALLSIALVSCADIDSKESGSVSFSLSPELAKAVLGAGRSARAGTDDGATGGDTVTPTEETDSSEYFDYYKIEVLMKGGRNEKQERTYTSEEWKSIATGTGVDTTFTFNDIRVGSEISVSATIYCGYEHSQESEQEQTQAHELVWPCWTGTSDKITINDGENPVSFNVHKLAMVNLYNNTESGETISDISKLDVYALPKDSEVANKILALVAKDDSKNDPEIYEILSAYSKIYSYSKPDSPYLTGGYELKNGAEVYMLSLLYTSDGVYLGHPDVSSSSETLPQDALTVIKIDEVNYIHLKLMKMDLDYTYIFPAKYENKTISAWYVGENTDENADYNGKVAVTKTEYSAVFLFSDKTFVITSHSKKVDSFGSIWKEKIHYVMRGTYTLSRGDFETGLLVLTPSAMYEANDNASVQGWIELSDTQVEQNIMSCEVSSGSFTPPSDQMEEPYPFYKKAENAYLRVYRGEIDDSLAPSSGDEPEPSVDYSKVCFFPTGYEDKTVAAWYASEDVTTDKSKFFALYLFSDNTFIATKREIENSNETREIEIEGQYTFTTEDEKNFENNEGAALVSMGDQSREFEFTIVNGFFSITGVDTTYNLQSGSVPTAQSETSGSGEQDDNLDIVFLFETEIGSGKYEELDKLPTLHINADDDIDSIVENYTTQAIMLGYDYNEELTDDEPYFNKETNVWIMRIYFDKVEIKEVFSATGQGTSDSITLSEKHSFTLTSYSTLTYEVKYSDGDSITDKVVSKGTWALSDDEKSYIITETEYYDFKAETLMAVKEPNPQTVSMANLNENGKFSYDSANGVSVMFTVVGDESDTVTIGGVTIKLEQFDTTDLGENFTVDVESNEKGLTVTATPKTVVNGYSYQWILDGVPVDGGTSNSYTWTSSVLEKMEAKIYNVTIAITYTSDSGTETYSASTTFTVKR